MRRQISPRDRPSHRCKVISTPADRASQCCMASAAPSYCAPQSCSKCAALSRPRAQCCTTPAATLYCLSQHCSTRAATGRPGAQHCSHRSQSDVGRFSVLSTRPFRHAACRSRGQSRRRHRQGCHCRWQACCHPKAGRCHQQGYYRQQHLRHHRSALASSVELA